MERAGFDAFVIMFHGGVNVALGDLAGHSGGPHVRYLNGSTPEEHKGLFAFDANFLGGVFVGQQHLQEVAVSARIRVGVGI